MRTKITIAVPVVLLCVLAACNVSDGPGVDPVTVEAPAEASLDGSINIPSGGNSLSAEEWVGDYIVDNSRRVLVFSFDVSGLPAGAAVDSAQLRLYQTSSSLVGTPYTALGDLILEHISYGDSFTVSAGTTPALGDFTPATVQSAYSPATWRTIDVALAVQGDLDAGRNHAQFRLSHQTATDNDGANDHDPWAMGEHATHAPTLSITYR